MDKKEMTAVEFLKEWGRMCSKMGDCVHDCPFNVTFECGRYCDTDAKTNPEKAVAIVQNWAEENPVKTFLSDLLEKHPKTPLEPDGTPDFCPHALGYCESRADCPPIPKEGCYKCWSRPLEE